MRVVDMNWRRKLRNEEARGPGDRRLEDLGKAIAAELSKNGVRVIITVARRRPE